MSFTSENNILFSSLEEGIATSEYEQSHIPFIGRLLIDTFIALAGVAATIATGGAATPLLGSTAGVVFGTAGSIISGATNTGIDIVEGNTDPLTMGLDIGLPIATEGLGLTITAGIKAFVPIGGLKIFQGDATGAILKSMGLNLKDATFNNLKFLSKSLKELTEKTSPGNLSGPTIINWVNSLNSKLASLRLTITSFTDILDKVTGALKRYLLSLIPQMEKYLLLLKKYIKKLNKVVSFVTSPFGSAMNFIKSRTTKLLNDEQVFKDIMEKTHMLLVREEKNIAKRSLLSNALISKYNIKTVQSRWILGYSTIIKETKEDGSINADFVVFFKPETTKHNGARGAIPEPFGKRPVVFKDVGKDWIEYIETVGTASWGSWYLWIKDTQNTSLFGNMDSFTQNTNMKKMVKGVSVDNLGAIFQKSLSIVPGYSLFNTVKQSYNQMEGLISSMIKGTYGTNLAKNITNYSNKVKTYATHGLPKSISHKLEHIYKENHLPTGTNYIFKPLDAPKMHSKGIHKVKNNSKVKRVGRK